MLLPPLFAGFQCITIGLWYGSDHFDEWTDRIQVECTLEETHIFTYRVFPSRKFTGVPGFAADAYATYALTLLHPLYGPGYYAVSMAAFWIYAGPELPRPESLKPFHTWYGSPKSPCERPFDYFYFSRPLTDRAWRP